jgi:hypothetical protein
MTPTEKRYLLPLSIFGLPFVLCLPWEFLMEQIFGAYSGPEESREAQVGAGVLITWSIFFFVCTLIATMIIAFRARQRWFARAYLVLASFILAAIFIGVPVILLLSD